LRTPIISWLFWILAKVNSRALAFSRDSSLRIVTTEWILAEFGDAYCDPKDRADFVAIYRSLLNDPAVRIVPSTSLLFQRGVDLFESRSDKAWSLTDCISFLVMRGEKLAEALTGDKHFEQAGFTVLLK
jgi:uncharacterized protein